MAHPATIGIDNLFTVNTWTTPLPLLSSVGSYGLGRTQPCGRATFRRLLLMHQTKEVSYYCSLKPPLIQCRAGVGNLPTVMCQIVIFFPELEFKNAGRNFAGANRRCLSKRQHAANQLIGSILLLWEAGALGSQGIRISVGASASQRYLLHWPSYMLL